MTKMGAKRIHIVRGRGGNLKYRAMRLESGSFAWAGEGIAKKTRVIDVVYNASNNELVRTKTLVKGAVVLVDAGPFKDYYEKHFRMTVKKKAAESKDPAKFARELKAATGEKGSSSLTLEAYKKRQDALTSGKEVDPKVEEQLTTGRLLAVIASRPGQSGRLDGYIVSSLGDSAALLVTPTDSLTHPPTRFPHRPPAPPAARGPRARILHEEARAQEEQVNAAPPARPPSPQTPLVPSALWRGCPCAPRLVCSPRVCGFELPKPP